MDFASERVIQLERALLVRNFDRSRADDELVIPYFEQLEQQTNPFIGNTVAMEGEKFRNVMDEYYTLRGWDIKMGRPTLETMKRFSLRDEAKQLGERIIEKD